MAYDAAQRRVDRIAELERKIKARSGEKQFKENVAAMRAEIVRLKAQDL